MAKHITAHPQPSYLIHRSLSEDELPRVLALKHRIGQSGLDGEKLLERSRGLKVMLAFLVPEGTYIPDFSMDREGVKSTARIIGFGVLDEASGAIRELDFDYEAIDSFEKEFFRSADNTFLELLLENQKDGPIFGFADGGDERRRKLLAGRGFHFQQAVGDRELYGTRTAGIGSGGPRL